MAEYQYANYYESAYTKINRATNAIWPHLLFKAWSKMIGNVYAVGLGGSASQVLGALTGSPVFDLNSATGADTAAN